ncbi:hypothetical protein [Thermococcus sp. M36]|uniref:hypothetical protein n=1 Tax=Thermococcus sp. M36 TaxID=1638261 RepID=UPI00143A7650|nr:hypothetical protein [Thermococcus sp. M36]
MRVQSFVRADTLYVKMRCPRCGHWVEGKRGAPLYCHHCGALFDQSGQVLLVIHEVEGF